MGGFLAGAAGGAIGSAYATGIQSMGNAVAFGDPLPSPGQFLEGIAFGALTGGVFNGISALTNGRNFWNGTLLPKNYILQPLGGQVGIQTSSLENNPKLTNDKLVSEVARRADQNVPSTGNPALDGIFKHQYATKLLNKYQGMYGNRGLETNVYFNNKDLGLRGFLDVKDIGNKIIYDFKFGNPVMSTAQAVKYSLAHPNYIINIVSRNGDQYIRIIVPK